MSVPSTVPEPADNVVNAPVEPYGKLFLRFLRFGALAWGGPVAQIDMIRQELVTEENGYRRATSSDSSRSIRCCRDRKHTNYA